MRADGDTPEVNRLWDSGARWRVRLTAYALLRLFITAVFVSCFVGYAMPGSNWLGVFALVIILAIIFFSPYLAKHSKKMEQNFTDNLSAREMAKEQE